MSHTSPKTATVYCGELCHSSDCTATTLNLLNRPINGLKANITINYEKFVNDPESLKPRILDLLQLAALVFCADRLISRGERTSRDNESWARTIEVHLPVIDFDFWTDPALQVALSECLQFMTGDRKYSFIFKKANLSPIEPLARQLSLFTDEIGLVDGADTAEVMLLSGGLDSLAGAIEYLNEYKSQNLITVTHKSSNSVKKTQKAIVEHLQSKYNNRLRPYGFECHNKRIIGSNEESQRTRMFLFSAIAFAICDYFGKNQFYIHENGITSLNLPGQGDIINARASRTTHPKTIALIKDFLRFFNREFNIYTPYCMSTKSEILNIFSKYNEKEVLRSSVSCSLTRKSTENSHCGGCSQCIDRRFAMFASGLNEYDATYTNDFITAIPDNNTKQLLYSTLRLACAEKAKSPMDLYTNYPDEITDAIEYWHCDNPEDSLEEIFSLITRFGDSVIFGAKAMRTEYDDLRIPTSDDSFLAMLDSKEYLKTPTRIRVEEVNEVLRLSIPQVFSTNKPDNENSFNDTVKALLTAAGNRFTREYPVLKFGVTSYRADLADDGFIIESKYLRETTARSKITDEIAADIIKIPDSVGLLFILYDPYRKITDDDVFIESFENKRDNCFVRFFR